MIRIIKANEENIDELIAVRMEMLREVNKLPEDYKFGEKFIKDSRDYFMNGNQITYLAYDEEIVGCATICYMDVLPTFSHPTGKRANIMNVYTKKEHRKQGIASTLLYMLIDDAKEKGATEIGLDAANEGMKIYYQNGFEKSEERMVMDLNKMLQRNIELAEKNGCKPHGCGCC